MLGQPRAAPPKNQGAKKNLETKRRALDVAKKPINPLSFAQMDKRAFDQVTPNRAPEKTKI
jgi:hypothetical protein